MVKDRKDHLSFSEDEYQELLKRSKKASSAPPPIKPLDPKPPSFSTPYVAPPEPGQANWEYWKNVESVELWQGLLLSLNIEPTGGGLFIQNMPDEIALTGHKKGGGFTPYEYMDGKGVTNEFLSRWHMIRNKLETAYAASGLRPSVDLTDFIRLPVFATLATKFKWEPLPLELASLAEPKPIKPASASHTPTSDGNHDEPASSRATKQHIKYIAALHRANPAATAKELRRICVDQAKAREGGNADHDFPFCLINNDIAIKGKTRTIEDKTFSNWFSEAKKLG